MTHTKTFPVTKQEVPQPHLTIVASRTEIKICSGWVPFILSGVAAISILLCIRYLGGATLFPTPVNLYASMIPIVKKGYLQVYPFTVDSNYTVQDTFFIKLPLIKSQELEYQKVIDDLLKAYPEKQVQPYRNCWLENPTADEPCLYDREWVATFCTRENSYGYEANEKEEFSPCFILKFDGTLDWKPLHLAREPEDASHHFDRGFVPVICTDQDQNRNTTIDIQIYPPKGFSYLYFPVSKFNSSLYLPPLVAVKVKGLRRNNEIKIKCVILTPNSYVLWNIGRVFITFASS